MHLFRYPGSTCQNNGTAFAKGNYDGCVGSGPYWHSTIDYAKDSRKVNDTVGGANPTCTPGKCNGTGTDFMQAATGLAVQRAPGTWLFIAHAFTNQMYVHSTVTAQSQHSHSTVTAQSPLRTRCMCAFAWMFNPTQHTVTATAQSQHSHSTCECCSAQ